MMKWHVEDVPFLCSGSMLLGLFGTNYGANRCFVYIHRKKGIRIFEITVCRRKTAIITVKTSIFCSKMCDCI